MLILTVDDHGDHRGHTHIPLCLILIVTWASGGLLSLTYCHLINSAATRKERRCLTFAHDSSQWYRGIFPQSSYLYRDVNRDSDWAGTWSCAGTATGLKHGRVPGQRLSWSMVVCRDQLLELGPAQEEWTDSGRSLDGWAGLA